MYLSCGASDNLETFSKVNLFVLILETPGIILCMDFYDVTLHRKTQRKYASIFANFANKLY